MTIAPAKWQRRCTQTSFEQRAQAKARLLGAPVTKPTPARTKGRFVPTLTFQTPYHYYAGGNTMPMTTQTQMVWDNWTGTGNQQYYQYNPVWTTWNENVNQVQLTREQRAAALQRTGPRGRMEVIHAAAQAEQTAADIKALELFLHVLKPEERETYEKEKCIYVRGSRGRRYRIRCGHSQSHNVELLGERDEVLSTLCAHPGERVPSADCWMVQKLTLEHDEDHFTDTANFGNGGRMVLAHAPLLAPA